MFVAFNLDGCFYGLLKLCLPLAPFGRKSTPKPFNRRVGTSFIPYSIVGWGFPFLIVLTGQVFDRIVETRGNSSFIQPLFGEGQTCWFNGMKEDNFLIQSCLFHCGRPSCYLLRFL